MERHGTSRHRTEQNRIVQLEGTWNHHPVKLPDHFKAKYAVP